MLSCRRLRVSDGPCEFFQYLGAGSCNFKCIVSRSQEPKPQFCFLLRIQNKSYFGQITAISVSLVKSCRIDELWMNFSASLSAFPPKSGPFRETARYMGTQTSPMGPQRCCAHPEDPPSKCGSVPSLLRVPVLELGSIGEFPGGDQPWLPHLNETGYCREPAELVSLCLSGTSVLFPLFPVGWCSTGARTICIKILAGTSIPAWEPTYSSARSRSLAHSPPLRLWLSSTKLSSPTPRKPS